MRSKAVELGLLCHLPEAGAGMDFTRVLRRRVTENRVRLVWKRAPAEHRRSTGFQWATTMGEEETPALRFRHLGAVGWSDGYDAM